jgi:hypothetical protein
MPLVTLADLLAPAKSAPSLKVHELSKQRVNDSARPMPPGGTMSQEDKLALNSWLEAGAQAGSAADATCEAANGATVTPAFSMEPLVAREGETCYEFKTHGSTTAVDNTPYEVAQGEHYANFYFKAPWPDGTVATRFGARYDNIQVLHHWLLFSTAEDMPEGFHATSPLPTLLGVNATLLSGWAVGGSNLELPEDVGAELPPKGTQVNIQWHFYNATAKPLQDMSAVQVCTVPAAQRKNVASVSWLGTEDLNGNVWTAGAGMPAHQESTFQGTCDPLREGMNDSEPIHVIAFWPHMHQLGTLMETFVVHTDGTEDKIFSKPFDFNHQIHYLQNFDLKPGERLRAACRFNNTTDRGVPFGESSDTEMCYQFTFSYPAHALENHVPSLIGATNTCW